MSPQRFTLDSLPVTPWKNGGGETREVLCWPPGAGLECFDWRVSVATIASDGPFSRFPGVERHIVLLEGDGVRLRGEGIDHRLQEPLRPFAFSGDVALQCTRLGGSSTDFNVMARRARGRATLRMLDGDPVALPEATHGLLLAVRGHWRFGEEDGLRAGAGCWWAAEALRWTLRPDSPKACLAAVFWQPLNP